jgi:tyrosine-protein kinase Etk/Wzc
MGKIREAFRLIPEGPPPKESLPSPPESETVSFIEIGPQRQIDASPDVLACPGPKHPMTAGLAFLQTPTNAPQRGDPTLRVAGSRFAPELVTYHAPGQVVSTRYTALLRTLLDNAGREAKILLFCGVRASTGATTVLLNLAITAAQQGRQVIVVDANLRRAGIAEKLGMKPAPGLTEVLAGKVALNDAIRGTIQQGLRTLTAGAPAALWADPQQIHGLFADLANQADLVLVDGPCWDGRGGVVSLASAGDAVFLVAPAAEADHPATSELLRRLPAQGVALAGCVLTDP